MIRSWELDARTADLDEITSWCLREEGVDRMLVALRLERHGNKWRYLSPAAGERVRLLFGRHVITGFQASEWPGTQLSGHPGFVYVIRFDEEVRDILLNTEPSLSGWLHNSPTPLPEDICLFKDSDAHPTLLSVTHESRAWLISDRDPPVRGIRPSRFRLDELFPPTKYFCRKYKR